MSEHFSSPLSNQLRPVLLRLKAVQQITGLSRSTIYELIAKKQFPRQVRLSERTVAWVAADVERWAADKIRESKA